MYVFPKRKADMDRRDSAGCICFDSSLSRVLLIKYYSHYSFPKGHIEDVETREEAAVRETEEESGIKARIVSSPVIVPSQKEGDDRKVYFFPALYLSGEPRGQEGETDSAFWAYIDDAVPLLSFDADRRALAEATLIIRNSRDLY